MVLPFNLAISINSLILTLKFNREIVRLPRLLSSFEIYLTSDTMHNDNI